MNLKSVILKFSIIFFILILIPVASAMDSNDTFFEEYDCTDYEEIIVEYDDFEEVEDTQEEVSLESDDNSFEDISVEEQPEVNEAISEEKDTVIVAEFNEDSVCVPQYSAVFESEDETLIISEIGELTQDIEVKSDKLTLNEISVDVQGSFFIPDVKEISSKLDVKLIYGISNSDTINVKNLTKVLELKDNLLINQDLKSNLNNYNVILNSALIISINKITNDFAYSIDNSIVGDECEIIILQSCFLKFNPCFDTVFCCNFLDVDFFSMNFAVENIFWNWLLT